MNYLTASQTITGIIARSVAPTCLKAHLINEQDMEALHDVARWLVRGAVERNYAMTGDLPTVNIDELHVLAAEQAVARYGMKKTAAAAMGVDKATLWRWLNKSSAPTSLAADEC